jgi:hypothetical protein
MAVFQPLARNNYWSIDQHIVLKVQERPIPTSGEVLGQGQLQTERPFEIHSRPASLRRKPPLATFDRETMENVFRRQPKSDTKRLHLTLMMPMHKFAGRQMKHNFAKRQSYGSRDTSVR